MRSESPSSKGLSRVIDSEARRSPRTVCTASAMAIPPMPRPATSAVMLIPRLSSASRIASPNSTTRAANISTLIEPLWRWAPSAESLACRLCSRNSIIATPQTAACSHATTMMTPVEILSTRSGRSSTRSPAYSAATKIQSGRVRVMSSNTSSTQGGRASAETRRALAITSRRIVGSSTITAVNAATANAQVRTGLPKKVWSRKSMG